MLLTSWWCLSPTRANQGTAYTYRQSTPFTYTTNLWPWVPHHHSHLLDNFTLKVGRDYGAHDVGTLTQRFMRIERFIPFWAEELTSFTTPFEAGNGYSVRLDKKENFIGKPALQKQKENGVNKHLVFFHLNDIDPDKDIWPWGGEPLYRNNEFVGTVTSAG